MKAKKRTRAKKATRIKPAYEGETKVRRGNESKLEDPAFRDEVLNSLRIYKRYGATAAACGFHRNTWITWRELAAEGVEPYKTFIEIDVPRALVHVEGMLLAQLHDVALHGAKMRSSRVNIAMWILSHGPSRENYRLARARQEITGKDGKDLIPPSPREEVASMLDSLSKRIADAERDANRSDEPGGTPGPSGT